MKSYWAFIAVRNQQQLDDMKPSLDDLETMTTASSIPPVYQGALERMEGFGCTIERFPDGQVVIYEERHIDNGMEHLRKLFPGSCSGSFENDKADCQTHISKVMWLTN